MARMAGKFEASTRGRRRGIDYGAQIRAMAREYGFFDQAMASLTIRGRVIPRDPSVEFHVQNMVRTGEVVRCSTRYQGRTVYHLPSTGRPNVAHQYPLAKLTHHLVSYVPAGRLVTIVAKRLSGLMPDMTLEFFAGQMTVIYLEYQTNREAWTTAQKIAAYREHGGDGLKLFLIERSDAFLVSMAQLAATGDFCFGRPDAVLASVTPWEAPLFYFGGSQGERLSLIKLK